MCKYLTTYIRISFFCHPYCHPLELIKCHTIPFLDDIRVKPVQSVSQPTHVSPFQPSQASGGATMLSFRCSTSPGHPSSITYYVLFIVSHINNLHTFCLLHGLGWMDEIERNFNVFASMPHPLLIMKRM